MFDNFDFSLLNSPDFKEDSVREELIVPILKRLGYSASSSNKIIRSKRLEHPYVYIGSTQKKISIVPDYLLQFNNNNFWILDAKAPWENIREGKNVAQAFSYAIHKDVRVKYYALCNGKEFTVFDISSWPFILDLNLESVNEKWHLLDDLLGTKNRSKINPDLKLRPDLGLYLLKAGLATDDRDIAIVHHFPALPIASIVKLQENMYSITAFQVFFDEIFALTFDFDEEKLQKILLRISDENKEKIEISLKQYPFKHTFETPMDCQISLSCFVGNQIFTNENESYCPFFIV